MKTKVIMFISLFSIALPLSALTLYKQSRVTVPEWFGVTCIDNYLCLEDITKKDQAKELYEHALRLTEQRFSKLRTPPKAVFCSSIECSERFGLKKSRAFNVGTLGIIISSRGWKKYAVTHEFIHYWQSQTIGNIKMLNREYWITEGMAYSMSEDTREKLVEPFESYKIKFNNWFQSHSSESIELAFLNESASW